MVVYVPQGYVALVYEGRELRAVLESGAGFVAPAAPSEVQYVYLQTHDPAAADWSEH